MQENNRFKVQIALFAIGILLIVLSITILQVLRVELVYQVPLLLKLFRFSPFLGLTVCFSSWRKIVEIRNISREVSYFGELYIFVSAFLLGLSLVRYSRFLEVITSQMLFYINLLYTSSFFRIRDKTLLLVLMASSIFSMVVSYFAYPFYNSSGGELWLRLTFMPNLEISFFYVLVLATALLSLFSSYSLMSYVDTFMQEILGRPSISLSALKSVAVHLQLIPIVLSPLAILQTFGRDEFVEPVVILLFALCYSKVISMILSPLIGIAGRHIGDIKFLGVTSLWSSLSFIQNAVVVFNFIVLNIDAGSYAFTLIVSSLFATALGFASSRSDRETSCSV